MTFQDFITNLNQKLQLPLPGRAAHVKMMPPTRLNAIFEPNERTRQSAVMLLFYPSENNIFFPLILRPAYDGVHGGQMALPGGQKEKSDESLIRTALREAQEEIGIRAIDVKILGKLSEIYIPPSNFTCLPVIGYLPFKPNFFPDAREVDTIFEVSINELLDPNAISQRKVKARELIFETPCFLVQNQVVWGATAIMLAELLVLLQDA